MASNGNRRGKLLTAGGVLSILAGIFQIIFGLFEGLLLTGIIPFHAFFMGLVYSQIGIFSILCMLLLLPLLPLGDFRGAVWYGLMGTTVAPWLISVGSVVLGIMAVIGGISAIRRKWFRISLAGAIGALPSIIPGILAVIFVTVGKREFRVEK
jgi:hypothetical protein